MYVCVCIYMYIYIYIYMYLQCWLGRQPRASLGPKENKGVPCLLAPCDDIITIMNIVISISASMRNTLCYHQATSYEMIVPCLSYVGM